MSDQAVTQLGELIGIGPACRALGVPRGSWYARRAQSASLEATQSTQSTQARQPTKAPGPSSAPGPASLPAPGPGGQAAGSSPDLGPARARRPQVQPRALSQDERAELLAVLRCAEHVDKAPATIYAILLDQGRYLGSVSTMYRLLREQGEVRERRRQATHPVRVKPERVATGPNQVWSWDITKLAGPAKWTYYYLYVIIDIYSRYVVGWMISTRESAWLAERLLAETIASQHVERDQLTIHADRGSSMASKPVALLLADLGVTKSHSRPRTSNDNPYSEAQFKTLKYRPDFPERFGALQDARGFCERFVSWYNDSHRHCGIGYHIPADVHYGRAEQVRAARQQVLGRAYQAHPERFVRSAPQPPALPGTAWINRPAASGPEVVPSTPKAGQRGGEKEEKMGSKN